MASEALSAYSQRADLAHYQPNALGLFALQLRFGIDDIYELSETITDGDKDKKCDLFYIDEGLRTAVIVQAWEAQNPGQSPILNKATDLHAAVSWLVNPTSIAALNARMQSAASDLASAIEDGQIDTLEIWFSHNCPNNPDVDAELTQVATTAKALLSTSFGDAASGIDCVGVQVGATTLDQWYARQSGTILIEDEIDVPVNGSLEETGPAWRAVLTSVPGDWLKALHDKYGPDKLFAGNVRDFLGARPSMSRINSGILATATNEPANFWAFNNGVTALTRGISSNEHSQLTIHGMTIVNGAQTTGTIASSPHSEALRVPIRFVECSDQDLIQGIKRANNTQNAILASDFRSSDACQTRLRQEFSSIPNAHYSGARRGELTAQVASKDDLEITADQAAQALAAFHGEPHRAYHAKERIWVEDTVYDRFFSARTTATHVVFTTSLVRAINDRKLELRFSSGRSEPEEEEYQFLSQRGSQFLLTAAIAHVLEIVLGTAVDDHYRVSFGDQVSPAVAAEIWAPLIRSLVAFHGSLQGAAESGKIRSDEARKAALAGFRAQVNAVRAPLEPVFAAFRPYVIAS